MKTSSRLISIRHVVALFTFLVFLLFLSSCKKENSGDDTEPAQTGLSDQDSLKYLMHQIMQVSFLDGGRDKTQQLPTYYWYKQVPQIDPLNPAYATADALLDKMREYPKDNQGDPIDKYSFLDDGSVSDQIQGGVAGDLGMEASFALDENKKAVLVILYADKNGPAGNAGVKRGYLITKIDGGDVVYDQAGVQKVQKALYSDEQPTFTFQRQDKSTFTKQLYKAVYPINPVLFDTVYTVAGKRVGYFVFYTFSNVSNASGNTLTKTELDRVFSKFAAQGVTNLIVDFRYNMGGATATAEYISDKIAPASANGKLMYKYVFNDKMTKSVSDLPEDVKFANTGGLSLQNVFFIGEQYTASASELTINNLKPYMNVKLVGDTTHGKPVGFFGFSISIFKNGTEKFLADLYAINFETRNADNQGEYYRGMFPDVLTTDYIGTPWGDASKDENLIKIFNYISTGSFGRLSSSQLMTLEKTAVRPVKSSLQSPRFSGMVDQRVSKVLKDAVGR